MFIVAESSATASGPYENVEATVMDDSQATRLNGSTAGAAGNGALLDRGVERAIITAEQRGALLALVRGAPRGTVEAKRGFNAVSVAYWTGGIAVLCAFA